MILYCKIILITVEIAVEADRLLYHWSCVSAGYLGPAHWSTATLTLDSSSKCVGLNGPSIWTLQKYYGGWVFGSILEFPFS